MDLKEIRQIVTLMNDHGLSLFHLEKKDFNIKLKKGVDPESLRELMSLLPAAAPAPGPQAAAAAPAVAPPAAGGEAAPVQEGEAITSPMVGTYYGRPSPDVDPFVSIGSKVSEGQTLCIIEAMKVMNEIKAERGGTIVEAGIEDGAPVQYGDELFRIK